jgi:hypothetical protein
MTKSGSNSLSSTIAGQSIIGFAVVLTYPDAEWTFQDKATYWLSRTMPIMTHDADQSKDCQP